jgi:hypothetical protein
MKRQGADWEKIANHKSYKELSSRIYEEHYPHKKTNNPIKMGGVI